MEGLYSGVGHKRSEDGERAELTSVVTRKGSTRVIRHAFKLAMQLVMNPHRFDVIVTTNLFGDILSDLCAGLVGGLGLAPGANIGDDRGIFEAVHGSAPDIAGKNIANPTALLLASSMILDYLELNDASQRVRTAVRKVIGEGKTTTPDLGGSATTTEYTEALINHL